MEQIAPAGPVYQAGTLSGNPLAMTAGIATLRVMLETPDFFPELIRKTNLLSDGLRAAAEGAGFRLQFHRLGSMFGLFFTDQPVYDYDSAKQSDVKAFNAFFHHMLQQGIYLAPSQFEAGFMSAAHTDEDIRETIAAGEQAFAKLAEAKGNERR
jgi:glutamate-1-semialdehyde 2,1-aminomutase